MGEILNYQKKRTTNINWFLLLIIIVLQLIDIFLK
jgi:predicted nucleic acid-binding Zn ribbon protein